MIVNFYFRIEYRQGKKKIGLSILLTRYLAVSLLFTLSIFFEGKNKMKKSQKHTAKTKKKISKAMRGNPSWSKGLTKEIDERVARMSKPKKGHCGVYIRTKEHRRILSKAHKGKKLGPHSEETRKKMSESSKGKCGVFERTEEFRKKQSKIMKIIMNSPKTKIKERIAWEKRVESSGYPKNCLCPNFNFKSVCIFEALDEVLFTKSRYGGMRAGEKKIGRYFVDYFNFKYRFIVEWNEDSHYGLDGYLSEKDIEKRRYILAMYSNWIYITIKESDWFKSKELTKKIEISVLKCILSKILIKNIKILKKIKNFNKFLGNCSNPYIIRVS